jgi:BirA family transcriptional regulator, biotin operon repressor / biotin---[acetyl-CoA-carboxylase] ligase
VVLGIGLNVNVEVFPPELDQVATSLRLVGGRTFDRATLVADFLNRFEPAYDHYVAHGPAAGVARFRQHARLGERCRFEHQGHVLAGVTLDVDDDGALRVRDDRGDVHRVLSGEVHTIPDEPAPAV